MKEGGKDNQRYNKIQNLKYTEKGSTNKKKLSEYAYCTL
jgi:hypothetical protein